MNARMALCLASVPCPGAREPGNGADPGSTRLPEFAALAEKASESVNVTLDSSSLGWRAAFSTRVSPKRPKPQKICASLTGIYVRKYTFDTDYAYPKSDIDGVRKQLSAPGWSQIVGARSKKEQTDVDVYMLVDGGKARASPSSRANRASSRSSTSSAASTWNSCTSSKASSAFPNWRSKPARKAGRKNTAGEKVVRRAGRRRLTRPRESSRFPQTPSANTARSRRRPPARIILRPGLWSAGTSLRIEDHQELKQRADQQHHCERWLRRAAESIRRPPSAPR